MINPKIKELIGFICKDNEQDISPSSFIIPTFIIGCECLVDEIVRIWKLDKEEVSLMINTFADICEGKINV